MFILKRVAIVYFVLIFFGIAARSQAAPAVSPFYVSGGAFIYKVSGTTVQAIVNNPGSNFESLSIGPDWVDKDSAGNAAHPFLLYACDTALNRVIRFDPANTATTDTIYSGTVAGLTPVCGRSSASGDFFITNKAGSGVWKFAGVASQPLGSLLAATPTAIPASFPAGMTGAGITQKNVADLLVVDTAENKVLRSPYATIPSFATQSSFIANSLSAPIGIARFSNGDVFVANSSPGSGKNVAPVVAHFGSTGAAAASCATLSMKANQTPQFLAAAENDVLYLVTRANSSGTVWTWDATQTSCALTALATVPTSISGIAVGPVPTSSLSAPLTATATNPAPNTFMFNSNAFQIVANGCIATVTAYPLSPATVSTMIGLSSSRLPDGAVPALNLGEGGYSIGYVAKWTGCASVFPDLAYLTSIYGLFDDKIANNPRIIRCEGGQEPILDGSTSCQPLGNQDLQTIGEYPLGGIIPQDFGTTIKTSSNSTFVLVNANSGAASASPGTFCGYQTPLVNTTDPNQAAVFTAGTKNTLSVKFKLAAATGDCQNGNFITNATALISVARLTDKSGNPSFQPISIASTSVGLADAQPLYNTGNQQYQFTLNLQGYASGVYSLTTTFLTDNTVSQTILFKIK